VRIERVPTASVALTGVVHRATPVAVALGVAAGVAGIATADAPPSVLLVLVGLLAGVGAVLTAIRLH
jgi:hypothetical protein